MVNLSQDFDPTIGLNLQQEFKNCSIGKAPSGFPKIHVEMLPGDLIKMIAYDPRTIQSPPRRGQQDPQHVSREIINLIREVQRSIDQEKVEEMVNYLSEALSNGHYADWAELDVVTASKPETSRWEETHSLYFPIAAEYFITDGQHRFCALMDFVRRYPQFADKFTQAVAISVLPQDRLAEWAGQSFHDKNYLRTSVKVTKALAVDSRDLHNVLARDLMKHPVIQEGGGVNEVKDALAAGAKEFATHAALYRFTRGFCEGRRGLDRGAIKTPRLTEDSTQDFKEKLSEYVTALNEVLPYWTVSPGREEFLFRSSPALQALGVLGYELYSKVKNTDDRRAMISRIGEGMLDWRRTNVVDWSDVIGTTVEKDTPSGMVLEVSPRSNRQSIDGTIRFLRNRSGLSEYLNRIGQEAANTLSLSTE